MNKELWIERFANALMAEVPSLEWGDAEAAAAAAWDNSSDEDPELAAQDEAQYMLDDDGEE